ncbi:Polynucleotidyl transferase- ribonuclease H-like superfamily protein, partial [Striga hermonthica]
HSITVRTSYPLRQVLHRPDTSGRMIKWAIELGQFDIHYQPRTAIKAQALSDFIAEFTPAITVNDDNQPWVLYIDGSSTANRAGVGIVLANPENRLFCHSVKFLFPATNNEAEYEALLSGLNLAESMNVKQLKFFSDSQLLVNQINGLYEVKEPRLTPYLSLAKKKLTKFAAEVEHIPRTLTVQADALSRLASSTGMESMEYVQIGQQENPSTTLSEGLCFKCEEKFTPSHQCKQAFVIEVANSDEEGSEVEEEPHQEDEVEVPDEEAEISMHAMAGIRGPRTMRLPAWVKDRRVMVLVDNGSSHNFINVDLSQKLNLPTTKIEPFEVRVANGERLQCAESFRKVPIKFQGVTVKVDLYALPLVGPDVVLGVQWLEGLGKVTTDYRTGVM